MPSIAEPANGNTKSSPAARGRIQFAFDGLVLAALVVAGAKACRPDSTVGWPEAILLIAVTGSILASLCRELPLQNVLLAGLVIGGLGSAAGLAGTMHLPFGPQEYSGTMGPRIFGRLPWAVPLVWVTVILTARGVGRLVLRHRRGSRHYGFELLGLTFVLAVALDYGLETFARLKNCWAWESTGWSSGLRGTPVMRYLCGTATTLLILALAIPALIRKQPGEAPLSWNPLIIWVALNLLFGAAAVGGREAPPAVMAVAASTIVPVVAARGWRPRTFN